MKKWKKNLIAMAVLFAVCGGIYVNWLYTEKQNVVNLTDTLDADKVLSSDSLVMSGNVDNLSGSEDTVSEYFSAVRLSRQVLETVR